MNSEGTFKTLLADPPWYERGGGQICRGANRHYELMKTPDIIQYLKQIPMADDAHIYLWVTNNFLKDGLAVMEALGFRYITNLVWVKEGQAGLGQYFRGAHELLLFGVKGNHLPYKQINPDKKNYIPTAFTAPKQEHSRKPDKQYEIIEATSYPPYIEAFARRARNGWKVVGNEAPATEAPSSETTSKPCPRCGSKELPICDPETSTDGSLKGGVIWRCSNCGWIEF